MQITYYSPIETHYLALNKEEINTNCLLHAIKTHVLVLNQEKTSANCLLKTN